MLLHRPAEEVVGEPWPATRGWFREPDRGKVRLRHLGYVAERLRLGHQLFVVGDVESPAGFLA
jgi:hypothetical protein